MEYIITQPIYLWAFQTNREQLRLLLPFRSEKLPIIPQQIYDITINKNQKIDLLFKSYLSVILVKKLVGNIIYPRRHALRILSQQHDFTKRKIRCIATLSGNSKYVCSIDFHQTMPLLATSSFTKRSNICRLKLWNISLDYSSYTCVITIKKNFSICTNLSIVFHPTELILAICYDKTIELMQISADYKSLTSIINFEGHNSRIQSIAFHTSGCFLASASSDKTIKLWSISPDLISITCINTLIGHCGGVRCITFHPTANLIATGSNDNTTKLWSFSPDFSVETRVVTLLGHTSNVTSVAFHQKEPLLATGSDDRSVKLWQISPDIFSATCVVTLQNCSNTFIKSVAFHPTALLLATGSGSFNGPNFCLKLWRISPEFKFATCVEDLSEYSNAIFSMSFHPNKSILATGSSDRNIKLWK